MSCRTTLLALALLAACRTSPPSSREAPRVDASSPVKTSTAGRATDAPRVELGRAVKLPRGECHPTPLESACVAYQIQGCPGVKDLAVNLKISEPKTKAVGTVVFGTGGTGMGLYETYDGVREAILEPLLARGLRVVQYAWARPGWLEGPGGPYRLACRYATMIETIAREVHQGGPLCATGNSGASSEIGFGLARYGLGRLLDGVVLTGGLPLGRLDHGCLGEGSPGWAAECKAVNPIHWVPCRFGSFGFMMVDSAYASPGGCAKADPAMAKTWRDDSVLSDSALLDYPATDVRILIGERDQDVGTPIAALFARSVRSKVALTVIPGVDHELPRAPAGAKAILSALEDSCVAHPR